MARKRERKACRDLVRMDKDHLAFNEKLGKIKSTMQLYYYENDSYGIEWDIPSLEETIYIGIWVEKDTKTVIDYDGVFSLSQEAIEMLEENGFNCDQVRKDLK